MSYSRGKVSTFQDRPPTPQAVKLYFHSNTSKGSVEVGRCYNYGIWLGGELYLSTSGSRHQLSGYSTDPLSRDGGRVGRVRHLQSQSTGLA
jgi:hypothetical protein